MRNTADNNFASFLENYPGTVHFQAMALEKVNYRNLSIDSRTLKSGALFLALRGENHDGHAYVASALQKGAAGAVVEEAWWNANARSIIDNSLSAEPIIRVRDSLDFLQQLGAWHRRLFDLPVICVTGSNGKTTTREMIAAVLEQRYNVFRSEGNKNNHIGLPLMLLQLNEDHEIAVLELGMNHTGEIAMLAKLAKPTAAVVTNIGKAHIGFFKNLDEIYREKTSLFEAVTAKQPVFINVEDVYLRNYPRSGRKAITVGADKNANVWGSVQGVNELGCPLFKLNGKYPVQLGIPGRHNVMNAVMAAAVGLEWGLTEAEIQQALEAFRPAKQRMELISRNGILIINDAYNANPNSMRAALDHLSEVPAKGKRIVVLGDMLELGDFAEAEHRELGRYVAQCPIDLLITYGSLAGEICNAAVAAKSPRLTSQKFDSHEDIARFLQKNLVSGDVLLLKGSRGMQIEKVLNYLNL